MLPFMIRLAAGIHKLSPVSWSISFYTMLVNKLLVITLPLLNHQTSLDFVDGLDYFDGESA